MISFKQPRAKSKPSNPSPSSCRLAASKCDEDGSQWYRYRDEAVKEHVIAWAEANQVTIEDDTQQRKS
jgi:hypothetical protein